MAFFKNCGLKGLISACLAVALAACSKAPPDSGPPAPAQAGERSFEVRGIVRGIDPGQRTLTIEHEDIPGFMPSMTMPFTVKEAGDLRGRTLGEGIAFKFVVTDSGAWITGLRSIDAASVQLPEALQHKKGSGPRLKEGDKIPEFELVDEENEPVTRETLAGKTTVLTFIFTRCPIPNFCPLMSKNFAELQKRILADAALKERVRLLSISFDPADTPEVLAQYAKVSSADPSVWRHAGGTPEEVGKLTHAFSVYVEEQGGSFSHGLCTALVGPDGTIRKIWRGNDWSVDEVWNELQK